MALKTLFIYWPLLSIATAAVLCRLIHKAKRADRAMQIQRRDAGPCERKAGQHGTHHDALSDRQAA
jgi:hypothetical protein